MEATDGAARAQKRAQQRDLVRRGYDTISLAYRGDRDDPGRYRGWVAELAGLFLAIVGAEPCSGTDRFFGAEMFWEHAGTGSYLDWLEEAGLTPVWDRFVPEGDAGHSLILARAPLSAPGAAVT